MTMRTDFLLPRLLSPILFSLLLLQTASGQSTWNLHHGPYAGSSPVLVFGVSPITGTILAGTDQQGILRSTDNGLTWSMPDTTILPEIWSDHNWVEAFAFANDTIWAGQRDGYLLRSLNDGLSWQKIADINATTFYVDDAVIIASSKETGGMHRSTDRGRTWNKVKLQGLTSAAAQLVAYQGRILLRATTLYSSTDKGATWQPFGTRPNPYQPIDHVVYAQGKLLAFTPNGLYRSSDQGNTWEHVDQRRNTEYVHMDNDTLYVISDTAIEYSVDLGTTRQLQTQLQDEVTSFWRHDGVQYIGAMGICRSTNNGRMWTNHGVRVKEVIKGMFKNDTLYAASGRTLFRKPSRSLFFEPVFSARNDLTDISPVGNGIIYLDAVGGGWYRTFDNGSSWEEVNDYGQLRWMVGSQLFEGLKRRSTDNGVSWIPIDAPFSLSYAGFMAVDTVIFVWISDSEGPVFRSLDYGVTWDRIEPLRFGFAELVYSDGKVVTATERTIYMSSDTGATWDSIKLDREGQYITGATYRNGSFIVVAEDYNTGIDNAGVVITNDDGQTWKEINEGIAVSGQVPLLTGSDLTWSGDRLFMISRQGIYSRDIASGVVDAGPHAHPDPCPNLVTLYPNPAHDDATISYTLDSKEHVRIELVNSLGEIDHVVIDGVQEAGSHNLRFNPSQFSHRFLFCRVTAGRCAQTVGILSIAE